MISPLCGLDQRINFILRSRDEPQFVTAGAEMTGVHVLRGQPRPKIGSYHIGGSGIFLEEALIRSLGETVERYSQMVAEIGLKEEIIPAPFDDLARRGEPTLPASRFSFFSKLQYSQAGFPFVPFSPDMTLGWYRSISVPDGLQILVPAQFLFVGYNLKSERGEKCIYPAVTTGTASHTVATLAIRNCLLELIQIDSAMGHWYSSAIAPKIFLDERVAAIDKIVALRFLASEWIPEFYWLPNADLSAFTVACVIRSSSNKSPASVVGLGCDTRLVAAMYKALLEAVAVIQLSKLILLDRAIGERSESPEINRRRIYNLDDNVALYADPRQQEVIDTKFQRGTQISASELPPDPKLSTDAEIRQLISCFEATGKLLFVFDLSSHDVRQLGFTTMRFWSPDVLSLCLPGAPPVEHPRFAAYGGFAHDVPHPYP